MDRILPEFTRRPVPRALSVQEETAPGSGPRIRTPPAGYIVAVACGGGIGACLRHLLELAFPRDVGTFPLVTFAENVIGSFLLGLVLIVLLRSRGRAAGWRPFLATGVLGSFTTFSNVSVQVVNMAAMGELKPAGLYIGLSVAAGLAAAVLGITLGVGVTSLVRSRS
jgi:fluoride exporter